MPQIVKRFSFASNTENWISSFNGGSNLTMDWVTTDDSPNDPNSNGCLRTRRTGRNVSNGDPYWYWQGTWEDLGVPAGATVTGVKVDVDWRCSEYTTGAASYFGPAVLFNPITSTQRYMFFGHQVATSVTSWATASGMQMTDIADPSNTQIQLRVSVKPVTGNSTSAAVTILFDWVVVTIDYTASDNINASLSKTQDGQSLSSSAAVNVSASSSLAQTSQALSAQAKVDVIASATFAQAQNSISSTATTGFPEITAYLSSTQTPQSITAQSAVKVSASAGLTQNVQSVSAQSSVSVSVSAVLAQATHTLSAQTKAEVRASVSVAQAADSLSSTAVVGYPVIVASLSSTQAGQGLSAQTAVSLALSAAIAQAGQTISAGAAVRLSLSATFTQAGQSLSVQSAVQLSLSAALLQAANTLSSGALVGYMPTSFLTMDVTQNGNAINSSGKTLVSCGGLFFVSSSLAAFVEKHRSCFLSSGPAGNVCSGSVSLAQRLYFDGEQRQSLNATVVTGIKASVSAIAQSNTLSGFVWPQHTVSLGKTQAGASLSGTATAFWRLYAAMPQSNQSANSACVVGPSLAMNTIQNGDFPSVSAASAMMAGGSIIQNSNALRAFVDVYRFTGWTRR
jgi:hypothetical protein